MIVQVNVVLNRTIVVVDSDLRFDNLCSSHLQSQYEWYPASVNGIIKGIAKNIILEEVTNYTTKQTQARMDKLEED